MSVINQRYAPAEESVTEAYRAWVRRVIWLSRHLALSEQRHREAERRFRAAMIASGLFALLAGVGWWR
jgi:hypothetical protein